MDIQTDQNSGSGICKVISEFTSDLSWSVFNRLICNLVINKDHKQDKYK